MSVHLRGLHWLRCGRVEADIEYLTVDGVRLRMRYLRPEALDFINAIIDGSAPPLWREVWEALGHYGYRRRHLLINRFVLNYDDVVAESIIKGAPRAGKILERTKHLRALGRQFLLEENNMSVMDDGYLINYHGRVICVQRTGNEYRAFIIPRTRHGARLELRLGSMLERRSTRLEGVFMEISIEEVIDALKDMMIAVSVHMIHPIVQELQSYAVARRMAGEEI